MYKIIEYDKYLEPYEKDINLREKRLEDVIKRVIGVDPKDKKAVETALSNFSSAHKYFGFHKSGRGYVYREYAPNAKRLFLVGEFNGWDKENTELAHLGNGVFEACIDKDISGSRVKVRVIAENFEAYKIPMFATFVTRDENNDMAATVSSQHTPSKHTTSARTKTF